MASCFSGSKFYCSINNFQRLPFQKSYRRFLTAQGLGSELFRQAWAVLQARKLLVVIQTLRFPCQLQHNRQIQRGVIM